ncbi:MAG: DNA polymerase IV, partial [Firmicutes bacterium]|nr:DNA polymerase IV [Bacillota bacterium]
KGFWARTIGLKIRFADFTTITRETTLPEPTNRASVIYRTALSLYERNGAGKPCRLIGLRVTGLEPSRQLSLLAKEAEAEKEQSLGRVQDRLRGKYGREVVFRAGRLIKKEK